MANSYRGGEISSHPAPKLPQGSDTLIHVLLVCVQLALLALLYFQTQAFDYVYFDDADYILDNLAVRSGLSIDGIRWAFTSVYMSNWHPLTWLSHMLDVSLFGVDPGWAHIHNVVLHGFNSLLVYVLLQRYSGSAGKAAVLSVIFLVHPLHVESVAWIAERKDLICAFFFLLGLILYDSYRARPGKLLYAGIFLAFALSLLAKPMAVTFPVILLILDFFIYRKCFQVGPATESGGKIDYMRAIVEKLPFIALSAASCAITITAQDSGSSLAYLKSHSLGARWKIATSAYVIYLKQFLLPVDLAAFYPLPATISLPTVLLYSGILGVFLVLSLVFAALYPLIAAGFLWYLVTLLPVIGIVQVGNQAHADRYMYLPSVGLLMACVYLLPARSSKRIQLASVVTCFFIAYLSTICYWQIGYWRNQHILFTRVLEISGPTYLAHLHLSADYIERGMLKKARTHGFAAIKLRPDVADAYQAIGNIALAEEKFEEAEKYYRLALSKGPALAGMVNNLGITLTQQGDIAAGVKAFEMALEIEPAMLEAQKNLLTYTAKLPPVKAP